MTFKCFQLFFIGEHKVFFRTFCHIPFNCKDVIWCCFYYLKNYKSLILKFIFTRIILWLPYCLEFLWSPRISLVNISWFVIFIFLGSIWNAISSVVLHKSFLDTLVAFWKYLRNTSSQEHSDAWNNGIEEFFPCSLMLFLD